MSRANQRRIDPAMQQEERRRSLKRIGTVMVFTLMVAVSATSVVWLNQKWSVTHWDIKAEVPIKIAIAAQLKHMPSRDFLSTRPDLLRQQWLQRIPDLAAVRITRILPDRLKIQADARVPIALWQDEQSRLYLVDAHGPYRLLRKGESPDLPLLRMPASELPAAHSMLAALAREDMHRLAALSEIRAGNGHWQIYFSRGVIWLIPQSDEGSEIQHISSLLKQPRWKGRHWRVDARLASRWFIRPAGHGGVI
jgi:cell division septal protein FtsQ